MIKGTTPMNIAYNISQHLTLNPPLWVSRKQELKWLDGIQGGPGLIFCLAFFSKEDAFFFAASLPTWGGGSGGRLCSPAAAHRAGSRQHSGLVPALRMPCA